MALIAPTDFLDACVIPIGANKRAYRTRYEQHVSRLFVTNQDSAVIRIMHIGLDGEGKFSSVLVKLYIPKP